MIRKVILQDWAIYESWESPEFVVINDVYAANSTGKSTLVDAITVSLGLAEKRYLFENRTPESYQRVKGQPAFILAWMNNPVLPSGKRRFEQYGDTFRGIRRSSFDS